MLQWCRGGVGEALIERCSEDEDGEEEYEEKTIEKNDGLGGGLYCGTAAACERND